MIIDAWGRKTIFTIDENKRIKTWHYSHTIYVSGERLEKVTDQIDQVPWIKWATEEKEDIFSRKRVIAISVPPNRIEEIVLAIEKTGNFGEFKIYNADLNLIQSFMVKNNLHFFEDNRGMDFDIPDLNVLEVKFIDSLEEIEINGDLFTNLHSSIDYFFSNLKDANVVISEGGDRHFPRFFNEAESEGYFARTHTSRERTFTSYGRINHRNSGFIISGVPHVDRETSFIFGEGGMEGLVTISKITSLPLFHSARITPGTAVSSYEVRKSLEKGIMIPLYKDDHEMVKDIDTFITADKGGLYLQPFPGVYEGVYEIDFSSMYPSIIVKYNLSPETINVRCTKSERIEDLGYEICMDRKGILPQFLSDLLDLRLYYKGKRESDERYRMRDSVLKWLLLTSFGYTGYKNAKFGRIEVHESITSIGRRILTESVNIAEDEGFKVIHGIVDSLWLQGDGNVFRVMKRIEEMSRLPQFLSDLLDLRLYYKGKRESDERYRMRDSVLKWLLLTSFGYTGYKNAKFGRIEVHESITSIGRRILTESVNIAEDEGFKVIHGIVDSLWLQGDGNVFRVMKRIEEMSRLKISLEGYYRWIVFLPAKDGRGALNRYFGLMDNGKFKVRGIEMRRTDFPNICKEMQEEVLKIYSKVSRVDDFRAHYAEAKALYHEYIKRIVNGRLRDSDLKISMIATRYPEYYKVGGIRKSAMQKSRNAVPGDRISMFVVDEKRRQVAIDDLDIRYDKNYYLRKLEAAWESISYPLYQLPLIYQNRIEDYDTDRGTDP